MYTGIQSICVKSRECTQFWRVVICECSHKNYTLALTDLFGENAIPVNANNGMVPANPGLV